MSNLAITIHVVDVPEGWMWQRLDPLIKEGQAASLGNKTYQFHTYSDGCAFQNQCDELGISYTVNVEGED